MKISALKKISLCTAILFPILISCQSNKNQTVIEADSYSEDGADSTESLQLPEVVRTADEEESMTAEESIKSARKPTNAFQDFFSLGNKNELMVCDQTSLFTLGISGKPAQKEAIIALNTKDGTAGFGSAYLAAYYFVQMDEKARHQLAKAVENYLSDFENKRLQRKGNKRFKQYGSMDVKLHWGSIKSSTPNNGSGQMYLGYSFENKSPYFTLFCYPIKNDYYDVVGDSAARESLSIKYFFTKAQAQDLVNLLSDNKIAEYLGITKPFIPVDADEY
ncbi:MAG: hypothetical protein IJ688_14290 [Treponema sp.]|nr:hypothetical protein [Treponema sp.]